MFKYGKNSEGAIIRDFGGQPFLFQMHEDIDGFFHFILGYARDEYTIHYLVLRPGLEAADAVEHIEYSAKYSVN